MLEPPARPPIAAAPLSVVLLAGRTAEREEAVDAWRCFLGTLDRPFEILAIGEAESSTGDTETFRSFAYDPAVGIGPALQQAIRAARHPLIVTATADRQYQPADLSRLLGAIDKVDLVLGYRVWRPAPFWRRWLDAVWHLGLRVFLGGTPEPRRTWLGRRGWGRRLTAYWLFGLHVIDPECPFRLYRRQIFRRIPIQSHGSFAQIEILAKANHLGRLASEEPVAWTPPAAPDSFAAEAARLFRQPDFGPLRRPEDALWPLPDEASAAGATGVSVEAERPA